MPMIDKQVIRLAAQCYRQLQSPQTFPLSLDPLIKSLGFQQAVVKDQLANDEVASIDPKQRQFYFNAAYPERQHYIAQTRLLGHVVIYSPNQSYVSVRQPNSLLPKERMLDDFMQALLLPEMLFKQQWQSQQHDLTALAEHFGVTPVLVWVRAGGLGLVSKMIA